MSESIAKDDIVVENVHGQQVVVVVAGQPVPKELQALKDRLAGKAVGAPAENKARQAPVKK